MSDEYRIVINSAHNVIEMISFKQFGEMSCDDYDVKVESDNAIYFAMHAKTDAARIAFSKLIEISLNCGDVIQVIDL